MIPAVPKEIAERLTERIELRMSADFQVGVRMHLEILERRCSISQCGSVCTVVGLGNIIPQESSAPAAAVSAYQ